MCVNHLVSVAHARMVGNVTTVNSKAYWDHRFATDWNQHGGPAQSRGFAELARELLPRWLLDATHREALTWVDWGCAEGDGTAPWTAWLAPGSMCGVDVSETAIATASTRYPTVPFATADWLADDAPLGGAANGATFDVVFSSNTLEHFSQPSKVMNVLAARARRAVVLLLPYRELERHPEHEATFLPENLPSHIGAGRDLALCAARVADCRDRPASPWLGEQILLVYAQPEWAATYARCMMDVRVDTADPTTIWREVAVRDATIRDLQAAVAAEATRGATLAQQVVVSAATVERLTARITFLEARHAAKWSTRVYRFLRRTVGHYWVHRE